MQAPGAGWRPTGAQPIGRRSLGLVSVVALSGAVLATACGDGDSSERVTLDDYFAEVETLSQTLDEESTLLDAELETRLEEAESFEDGLAVYTIFVDDTAIVLGNYAAEIDAIEPPREAAAAHEVAVARSKAFATGLEALSEALADVSDEDELEEVFSELDDEEEHFEQSCWGLQRFATSRDIEVDLRCDGA